LNERRRPSRVKPSRSATTQALTWWLRGMVNAPPLALAGKARQAGVLESAYDAGLASHGHGLYWR
jgi:hypothetical protein